MIFLICASPSLPQFQQRTHITFAKVTLNVTSKPELLQNETGQLLWFLGPPHLAWLGLALHRSCPFPNSTLEDVSHQRSWVSGSLGARQAWREILVEQMSSWPAFHWIFGMRVLGSSASGSPPRRPALCLSRPSGCTINVHLNSVIRERESWGGGRLPPAHAL